MFYSEIEMKISYIDRKPAVYLYNISHIDLNTVEQQRNIDSEVGKYLFHILYYGCMEDIKDYMEIQYQPYDKNQLKELYEKIESNIKDSDRNVSVDYILSKCQIYSINNINLGISGRNLSDIGLQCDLNMYILIPNKDESISIINTPRGDNNDKQ